MSGPRVVLIGPMGAGKTTVARILGDRWGVTVRDTDLDIEARVGKSVPQIFSDHGEEFFRDLEREAVAAAVREHTGVLALGGGAPLAPQTRAVLAGQPVVYLRVGVDDAVKRVGPGTGRPLLQGDVRSRVLTHLQERTPIYQAVATIVIDTDGQTPDEVADQIIESIKEREQ